MATSKVDCMSCLVTAARGVPADPPSWGRIIVTGEITVGGVTHATYRFVRERIACAGFGHRITWRMRWTSAVLAAMRS